WGMPVRSDVTPSDEHYKAATAALEGVQSWQPNWDDVAVSLSALAPLLSAIANSR
ncbi:2-aminoethylphosphonate ABC transporter substrate-binding protein, partial [Salmonella enterica subsp. enterica serovar Kentucky]|nr:2-aminoethylphosphonate ABC transporter substrate-binding protein [Salmonella enterica subsp. enterica serovar Kentucky]